MSDTTKKHPITRIKKTSGKASLKTEALIDKITTEEPLEIRLGYNDKDSDDSSKQTRKQTSIAVTMRTPGNDADLALGFLFTEGIITSINQVELVNTFEPTKPDKTPQNIIQVELNDDVKLDLEKLKRNFYMTSSCGICGKASIEAVYIKNQQPTIKDNFVIEAEKINQLSEQLRQQQKVFQQTGGIHASALFSNNGEIVLVKEDVGRHNALDKLIGYQFSQNQVPLNELGILVSGRASFELLQKTSMARSPMLIAVGAPSSLAIELAESSNITLIGFLGHSGFNIYTGEKRVQYA